MTIIESIQQHRPQFSKTEMKVADFILEHYQKIESYTITKIANEADVSSSAVLRFCQLLGFKGYKEFRFALANDIHENHSPQSNDDYFDQFTNNYIKVISQLKNIDRNIMHSLIDALKSKHPKYIFGMHYSSMPAKHLFFGLQDLGIMSQYCEDYIHASHLSNIIEDQSIFIIFSISGSASHFNRFFSGIKDRLPENSYLITLNPNTPLKNHFTHTLVLPGYALTNQSIIDCEGIVSIFVETLLNTLHND